MKAKPILGGLVIVVGGALAIFALLKSHRSDSAGEEEQPAPVVSVQLGALKLMTLHHYLDGYGLVAPMPATAAGPAADAPLAPATAGVVARINVVEGQEVQKGDVVLELNSSAMTLEYAQQELERQKQLYAQHNTSLHNLQNAQAQLAALQVVSPLSGTVARVNARPGAAVDSTTIVAEVIDLSRLAVRADLPSADAVQLKSGQEVQVLTEPPAQAVLSFVSPTVDTTNGTVLVRAQLPADSRLRPGQFLALRVVTGVHTNRLVAPEESVVTDAEGASLIAVVNGTEATQVIVQTGFRENGWVEITGAGLRPGQAVVTVGAYGLPKKTKVQVVNPTEGTNGPAEGSNTGASQEKWIPR
ncbi:MAG: efflux RND transporter periplasmic adaptor subunit, partial [Limisphaerales bacterium]